MLGQVLDGVAYGGRGFRGRPQRDDVLRRGEVGLREDDVQADDRSAGLMKLVYQIRDAGPRPGPLPDPAQAVIVDVDDDDRRGGRRARGKPLVCIEYLKPETLHEPWRANVERQGNRQRGERHDEMEPGTEAAHGRDATGPSD